MPGAYDQRGSQRDETEMARQTERPNLTDGDGTDRDG
jgi:hypothetical protein